MTDPTGIGAAIIGLIRFGYWIVGLLCLCLALWMPKSKLAKLLFGLVVIASFVGLPSAVSYKRKAEAQDLSAAVKAACLQSRTASSEMSPVHGFYTGPDALLLVSGQPGREQLTPDPGFGDVTNYMLDRKMSFIEMGMPPVNSRLRFDLRMNNPQSSKSPYLRLFIANAGAAECGPAARWASEYPAQRLPGLRSRGLLADHCIAVEGADALRSRYRMTSKVTPEALFHGTQYGLWQHALEVEDSEAEAVTASFSLFLHRDSYGNRYIACDKVADAKRFQQVVPILPDPRLVQPSVVTNDDPGEFPLVTEASRTALTEIGTLVGVDKMNATNIISEDGMVWIENNYRRTDSRGSFSHQGYFLITIVNGVLRKTPIRMADVRIDWITGLQVTNEHVRLIGRANLNAPSWLLEYSRKGEPQRALSLTPDQVGLLK